MGAAPTPLTPVNEGLASVFSDCRRCAGLHYPRGRTREARRAYTWDLLSDPLTQDWLRCSAMPIGRCVGYWGAEAVPGQPAGNVGHPVHGGARARAGDCSHQQCGSSLAIPREGQEGRGWPEGQGGPGLAGPPRPPRGIRETPRKSKNAFRVDPSQVASPEGHDDSLGRLGDVLQLVVENVGRHSQHADDMKPIVRRGQLDPARELAGG
jgi:hypothetical protein